MLQMCSLLQGSGVLCKCCSTIISPSTFEAHAGHKQRRNPYDGIMTLDGVTLRELASRLPPIPEEESKPPTGKEPKEPGYVWARVCGFRGYGFS